MLGNKQTVFFPAGDLMDEESVLEFLTSLEAMDLPDRIEEVNARILEKIVQETDYVAVLFCEYMHTHTHTQNVFAAFEPQHTYTISLELS